jgi:co-chaperonin GroES (HSP10)
METYTEQLSAGPRDSSGKAPKPIQSLTNCTLRPLPGRIAVMMLHESLLDYRDSRIIIPPTATRGNRWLGRVVGLGSGVTEVEFGDMLEMTRYGGDWIHHSLNTKEGVLGGHLYERYDSADGQWCCLVPDSDPDLQKLWHGYLHQVPGLITRARWERAGIIPARILYPLSDRLLVRLVTPPEKTGGIIDPRYHKDKVSGYGLVEEIGAQVNDIEPGDWVLTPPRHGTWYEMDDGERWMTIEEPDVLAYWPQGLDRPQYAEVIDDGRKQWVGRVK